MANPASPRESSDTTGTKLGYGVALDGADDVAALPRIRNISKVADETTKSGEAAVGGLLDHDAADGGGPVKVGGRAQDPTAQPDEVADNDRVDALFDRNGRLAVFAGSPYGSAAISAATSGDNTLVAAAGAGKRIAVWSYAIVVDGAVSVRFESGAGGTALSGVMAFTAAGEGISASAGGLVPLFVTAANALLNLELSGAVQVSGHVSYTVIDD